ncbi:threonylcarbamoyl-AMP synthase [Patescibacteria group bacterium]|nr:threonylcarbamoyl-AMP synthase [Patescibacteria group bacterium]
MKIVKIDKSVLDKSKIAAAVDQLKGGKVVVLPTDTSYGLCANAYNEEAVRKILAIKQRPANKPLSVIVRDLIMLGEVAKIGERELKIAQKYLPGPFTFVLPKKEIIPGLVSGGGNTIGVRIPSFSLIHEIMSKVSFPLTATSANISGSKAIYSIQDLVEEFSGRDSQPDLLVDLGDLLPNQPSTVVDLTCDPPEILRKGSGEFPL